MYKYINNVSFSLGFGSNIDMLDSHSHFVILWVVTLVIFKLDTTIMKKQATSYHVQSHINAEE